MYIVDNKFQPHSIFPFCSLWNMRPHYLVHKFLTTGYSGTEKPPFANTVLWAPVLRCNLPYHTVLDTDFMDFVVLRSYVATLWVDCVHGWWLGVEMRVAKPEHCHFPSPKHLPCLPPPPLPHSDHRLCPSSICLVPEM